MLASMLPSALLRKNCVLVTILFALQLFVFAVVYLFISLLHFDLFVFVASKHFPFIVMLLQMATTGSPMDDTSSNPPTSEVVCVPPLH